MAGIGSTAAFGGSRLIRNHRSANDVVKRSLERLSTGKRINRPSDDPSGFVAAEQLRGDLVELSAEGRAASYRLRSAHERESALGSIQRSLTDLRGSLTTAADGLLTPNQGRAIQQEIDATLDSIDLTASRVEGAPDSAPLNELREGGSANVSDGDLSHAAELVETQHNIVSRARVAAGASQRIEAVLEQLREDQVVITTQALSDIEDADFAEEAANLAAGQVLQEASAAALTYSNRELLKQSKELLEKTDVRTA